MPDKRSLYGELAVEADATPEQIDKAYRRHARKSHPDAGGTSEAFHALSHAYEILSNPDRRKAYDETGYEGELTAENVSDRAMDRINELINSVLDSDLPFETVDLIAPIRETLTQQKKEIGAGIRKLEKQAKRAEAMAARFKRSSGDNLIRRTLERRAADTRELAETTRHEEAVFAKAIEILSDYSFDFEPAARKSVEKPSLEARRPLSAVR